MYFTKKDPSGTESNLMNNANNHLVLHKQDYKWGSDKHMKNLFPRGKAYNRLLSIQFDYIFEQEIEESMF